MRRPIGGVQRQRLVLVHDMAMTMRGRVTGTVMTAAMTEVIVMSAANVVNTEAGIVATRAIKVTKATDTGAVMADTVND